MSGTDSDTTVGRVPHGPGRPWPVQHNVPVRAPWTEHRWAALVLPLVAVGLLAVTIWLDAAAPEGGPGIELAPGYGWPYAAIGLVFGGCCALVLLHDRRQAFGWALGWIGLFWSLDGLAQSYVRYGVRTDDALAGVNAALWVLNRFGAFLPMTVAVLLLIFPTGRFLEGRWGRVGQAALALMFLAALLVILAPANGRATDVALPPGVDLDAGAIPMSTAFTDAAIPVTLAVTILGVLVSMASVVVRYRRVDGVERDRMRWLAWSVLAMAVVLGLSAFSDLTVVRDGSIFVIASLPPVAMTIGIVRPQLVPVVDLLNATAVFALLSVVLVAVDLAAVALLDRVLRDALEERQVVILVLLLTVLLYGPLRQRLSVGGPPAGVRRPQPPVRRRRRARLDPRAGRRGLRAARGGRRRGRRRRSGSATSGSRWTDRAASGSRPRTGPRPPRSARCRSPTATRRSVGCCCRPADCAAASPAATSSCSPTWSGRPPPRRGPASSPTSSRTAGSGSWSRARRSAAGSAATCTTASARP